MGEQTFLLRILSPEGVFYEGNVLFLEFTSEEGEQGVYAEHAPAAMLLKPCTLRIHTEKEVRKADVGSGFARILKEQVDLLTEQVKNHSEDPAYDTV